MKKILLFLFFTIPFIGFTQSFNEDFENGIPAGWTVFDNGVGTAQSWAITTNGADAHSGTKAAQVLRENIGQNNTSEDWLVTPLTTIISNAQLRFWSRSQLVGDQGTKYEIRISMPGISGPTDTSNYTTIKTYTENELSASSAVYQENFLSLAAYENTGRYIAFVRVFKQTGTTTSGDKWLLDDVRMIQQCFNPNLPFEVTNVTAQTAILNWSPADGGADSYDVEYGLAGFTIGSGKRDTNVQIGHKATQLPANSNCQFYVRSNCSGGIFSEWIGPYTFSTLKLGLTCEEPIVINSIPFQVTNDNTGNYGNYIDTPNGSQCGTSPSSNYFAGNDVVYSFIPATSGPLTITMTPGAIATSLFIYNQCSDIGSNCLAGIGTFTNSPRIIDLNVTAGQTYYITVSSGAATPSFVYSLSIDTNNCSPKPTNLNAINITSTSADLTWTNSGFSSWEVAVQNYGASIPSGNGDSWTTTTFPKNGLAPGTKYQFWVRGECTQGSGIYTAWAGPYLFTTKICEPLETCLHTFRMTDTASNGWNGAEMQIIQNGVVVQTIGSSFTSGAGPIDISIPLCKNIPFELYWSKSGTSPAQCVVSIINPFGQTLYTKNPTTEDSGTVLYTGPVDCDNPRCDIPPTNLNASNIGLNSATLSWDSNQNSMWDIYITYAGGPAPNENTTPNYNDVTNNTLIVNSLLADTCYDFYVRVECPTSLDNWSQVKSFCTLISCTKPKNLNVTDITAYTANLHWDKGTISDTEWDILLIPSTTGVPLTQLPSSIPNYPGQIFITGITSASPYTVNALNYATIYFYYIRTVCSTSNKSVWMGPYTFNTPLCDASNLCSYKLVLTDAGGNGWEGGLMEIKQNGILVATIGNNIGTAGPITSNVDICGSVPYELYWKTAGSKPQEIGVQIISPFDDIVYTKAPGEGIPGTTVFSSIGNCVPPTCPKPISLQVGAITGTTAELSWTETGSATQWEVYVTEKGSAPPVNGSVFPGTPTPPYYIANSNPFVVTGLNPATYYTYYVRAICSTNDISTWTILAPKTFMTTAINDECIFAINVPVNPTRVCDLSVDGNLYGATESLPKTNPVCDGTATDDVWYSFVATAPVHIITIKNNQDSTTNLNHTVYQGSVCGSQIQIYCSNGNISVADNLTIGETYKVRIYSHSILTLQDVPFNICITTPELILNEDCSTAIEIPVNEDAPCVEFVSGSLTGAQASLENNSCIGNTDDDVWYSFVANSYKQSISIFNIVGTTNNLNFAVYSGSCNGLTLLKCSSQNTLSYNDDVFIEGQKYYIRVWSNGPRKENVTFDICVSKIMPPIDTFTTKYNSTQLVEDILLKTKCASITNVSSSSGNNFGSVYGIGYFEKAQSNFPFQNGIILSSGNILSAPGPNDFTKPLSEGGSEENNPINWPGDSDLENIIDPVIGESMNSRNASVLEFDFIPLTDTIKFNFLFASEEYGAFQCYYSDAFAFLLTDTTTNTTTNLAVVPGTSDPISVVTIRNQKYNSNCESKNVNYFDTFYGPNGFPPLGAPVNYNGITKPMVATSTVIPGNQYHIKLVIADRRDNNLDSAVFLEGGSFDIGNIDLGADLSGENALCKGETTLLVANLDENQYSFTWLKDNLEIPNETGKTLLVSEPGVYTINARYGETTCFTSDSITVGYNFEQNPGTPDTLVYCNSSNSGVFDLTQNNQKILAPYSNTYNIDYYVSESDANNNSNKITNPTTFINTNNPQNIFARIYNSNNSCYTITSFQIKVEDLSPKYSLTGKKTICPNGCTTISVVPFNNSFDINSATYTWKLENNVLEGQNSSSLEICTSEGFGTYTVIVSNGQCSSEKSFTISEETIPFDFNFESGCYGDKFIVWASPIDKSFEISTSSYEWTGSSVEYTEKFPSGIIAKEEGLYSVKITTKEGCVSERFIDVTNISCEIPKGISPNGDGKNEFLVLTDTKKLDIYNRYGVLVYSTLNYENNWYGQTSNGKDLPDGTYFYTIRRNTGEIVTGWIYIKR